MFLSQTRWNPIQIQKLRRKYSNIWLNINIFQLIDYNRQSANGNFYNDKRFLGYGGPGPPLSPPFNPDRAGEPLPPTGRELVEYAIHLSSEFEGGGGNFPQEELIK